MEKPTPSGPPAAQGGKSVSFKPKASLEPGSASTRVSAPFLYPTDAVPMPTPVRRTTVAVPQDVQMSEKPKKLVRTKAEPVKKAPTTLAA
ncbi:hypothetical protein CPB97_006804, partial [Podila verticillata]